MLKPRSVMMYGVSGSTKTSQLYHIVKWLLGKNPGKKFRMIHSDGGGYAPFVDSGLIASGQVEVFDFSNRQHALSDYRKLSQGYWPRYTKDGQEWFKKDEACKTKPEEWNQIIGYGIESMSSVGETLKTHISNMKDQIGSQKDSFTYEEDGEIFTGLTMSHYNVIQKEVYAAHITGFNCLPIQWLVYTSLLGKGEDKSYRETVYGPQLVGSASTPAIPSWFMDCIMLDKQKWLDKNNEQKEGMVAWFTRHNDPLTDVPCLAKARVLPELYTKLLEYFPNGFVPLSFGRGITDYFKVLDSLKLVENKQ